MGAVQAGKALHLMRKSTVLVASLHELAPHLVEPLVMLLQQLAVPLPHLQILCKVNSSGRIRL